MIDEVNYTRKRLRQKIERIAFLSKDLLYIMDNPREPLPDDNHKMYVNMIAHAAVDAAQLAAELATYSYPSSETNITVVME